jgi:hypothetical protein
MKVVVVIRIARAQHLCCTEVGGELPEVADDAGQYDRFAWKDF